MFLLVRTDYLTRFFASTSVESIHQCIVALTAQRRPFSRPLHKIIGSRITAISGPPQFFFAISQTVFIEIPWRSRPIDRTLIEDSSTERTVACRLSPGHAIRCRQRLLQCSYPLHKAPAAWRSSADFAFVATSPASKHALPNVDPTSGFVRCSVRVVVRCPKSLNCPGRAIRHSDETARAAFTPVSIRSS